MGFLGIGQLRLLGVLGFRVLRMVGGLRMVGYLGVARDFRVMGCLGVVGWLGLLRRLGMTGFLGRL